MKVKELVKWLEEWDGELKELIIWLDAWDGKQ